MARGRPSNRLVALVDRAWTGLMDTRVVTLAAAVVLGAAAAVAAALLLGDDDAAGGGEGDPRSGSEVVSREGGPLTSPGRPPTTYWIVYRVEERSRGARSVDTVDTEELWVRRPFDGRLERREGAPPGGGPRSVTVSRFGWFAVESPASEPSAIHQGPNPAVGDAAPLGALEWAREEGLVELGARRRIEALDRECQVYRVGAPPGVGPLVPVGEGEEGEDAELCVDASGLVLEQVHLVGGRVLARKLAVELDTGLELGDERFAGPDVEPLPAEEGGGAVQQVADDHRPPEVEFWELPRDAPADGFEHRGRYAVVPPQARELAERELRAHRRASVADVWGRGGRFIAVERGGTLGEVDAFGEEAHAVPVDPDDLGDLGDRGEAELLLGVRFSEVRVRLEEGRFVRVYGTVAPGVLVEVARALEPVETAGS